MRTLRLPCAATASFAFGMFVFRDVLDPPVLPLHPLTSKTSPQVRPYALNSGGLAHGSHDDLTIRAVGFEAG